MKLNHVIHVGCVLLPGDIRDNLFYAGRKETTLDESCPGPSNEQPYLQTLKCSPTFQLSGKMSFKHNDT